MTYQRVLVAVDFSEASEFLCRQAQALTVPGTTVWLVHVIEPVLVEPIYDVMPAPLQINVKQVEDAVRRLRALGARVGVPEDQCLVDVGNPRTELLRLTVELGIDLLVVGSHGHKGVARLLGSTAAAALHGSSCDVLAVRTTGRRT